MCWEKGKGRRGRRKNIGGRAEGVMLGKREGLEQHCPAVEGVAASAVCLASSWAGVDGCMGALGVVDGLNISGGCAASSRRARCGKAVGDKYTSASSIAAANFPAARPTTSQQRLEREIEAIKLEVSRMRRKIVPR